MKTKKNLKIGVVGATGMVGTSFLKLLDERHFPVDSLRLFASEASAGKTVSFRNKKYELQTLAANCFEGLDLVFFSSGDEISRDWAPQAVQSGAFAVDNSAAFRMDSKVSLVVPEVNGHLIGPSAKPQIIANPNCSSIQLVMALKPLQQKFGLNQLHVATYQAVSGAGAPAQEELLRQIQFRSQLKQNQNTVDFQKADESAKNSTQAKPQVFPHQIESNLIPQIGSFADNGFCTEELKVMRETKKMLEQADLKVSAFTVRVPVLNVHSEAVWVTLKKQTTQGEIRQTLAQFPGVVVLDDPAISVYPTPALASDLDPVYVGRIHQDLEDPFTWLMWVVSDNIRKGAALNGIQIAERIFDISQ